MTSKLHDCADTDAPNGSFGFRGEVLASISDVSLLEIITKARGMPNGYRKVLKVCSSALFSISLFFSFAHVYLQCCCSICQTYSFCSFQGSKCLYLGVNDERKDVGTTGNVFFCIV